MRADRAFRELMLAAFAGTAALTLPLLITLFPGTFQRALHGYDALAQACVAALYRVGVELPPLGAFVLAIAGVAAAAGLLKAARTIVRTRRALRGRRPIPMPPSLARAADVIGVEARTTCFDDARPLAYCAGFIQPRVWISTGAVAQLQSDELEAVLWHEAYHLRRHDPLRILFVRVLREMLFAFPLVDGLAARFEVAKELDADREALRAQGSPASLAGALTVLGLGALPFTPSEVAVGAWSSSTARVDQLCGTPAELLLPPVSRRARLGTGLVLAALLLVTGGQVARANLVPAVLLEGLAQTAETHTCPLPAAGVLL